MHFTAAKLPGIFFATLCRTGSIFLLAGAFSSSALADFNYDDFSSLAGLQLNGNATQSGSSLQMTSVVGDDSSFFVLAPQAVDNSFTVTFNFTITDPQLIGGSGPNGADGLALVIQNDPSGASALGGGGSNIGYGYGGPGQPAIQNSVAFGVVTYNTNAFELYANGNNSTYTTTPPLASGTTFGNITNTANIITFAYNESTQSVNISMNGASVLSYDLGAPLSSLVGGSTALIGITAGTGDGASTQVINSISMVPEPAAYAVSLASVCGVLALCGSRHRLRSAKALL
jgi:hypothetical protein